jgi:hypothetical protein
MKDATGLCLTCAHFDREALWYEDEEPDRNPGAHACQAPWPELPVGREIELNGLYHFSETSTSYEECVDDFHQLEYRSVTKCCAYEKGERPVDSEEEI